MAFFNCKNCPAREPGCHGYCEDYINSKKEHEKAKAWLKAEKEVDDYNADNWARLRENARRKRRDDHL